MLPSEAGFLELVGRERFGSVQRARVGASVLRAKLHPQPLAEMQALIAANEYVLTTQRRWIFMQSDLPLIASNPRWQGSRNARRCLALRSRSAVMRGHRLGVGWGAHRPDQGDMCCPGTHLAELATGHVLLLSLPL
jgi:hypothetical protein